MDPVGGRPPVGRIVQSRGAKPLDVWRLDTVVRQLKVFSQQPIEIPGCRRQSKPSGGKRWWWPFG